MGEAGYFFLSGQLEYLLYTYISATLLAAGSIDIGR